jgi:dihydrofolate reductase
MPRVRMRKVVFDHLLSLDGYFGGANDEIDWFAFDEDSLEWSRKLLRSASSIVMGRRTFELMAQYWPTPQARKEEPYISERMTELPKLVFSRTLDSSGWENTRFERRPVAEVIREEKRGSGGHILVLGSSSIVASLWKEHLVDEVHVRIQPIVLGKGRPLFPKSESRQPLALKECRMFPSGVAALQYEVLPAPPSAGGS